MSMTPVKSDQSFLEQVRGAKRRKGLNHLELWCFFSTCLSLLIIFLAPSITSNDAGELGSAVFELGIAHPPGFPVFTIVQNGLNQLIGYGEIAFRGNLGSALWAAMSLSMIFFSIRSRGVGCVEAWCCGLLATSAPLFTVHAVTIEVYSSAGFLIALSIEILLRYLERKDIRYLFTLAIILGLGGLGHHPLLRLVGLSYAFFVLPNSGFKHGLVAFLVALAAGILSLIYLPIRSSSFPNRDWGSPRTLEALQDHVLGQRIQDSYGGDMWVWDVDLATGLFSQLFQSSPVLLILGCLGLVFIRSTRFVRVYAALFALDLGYIIFVNPMGVRDFQNGWLATLMLFALGSASLSRIRDYTPRAYPILQGALGIVLVWQIVQYAEKEAYSDANPWHESITKLTHQLEPESLVFTASDSASSIFAFLQVAHAARPDLAVIVRQHLFRGSSTGPTFRRLPHALEGWQPGARLENLIHLNSEWPLAWEWANGLDSKHKPALTETAFPFMTRGQAQVPSELKKWQSGTTDKLWSQRPQFVESIAMSQVATASAKNQIGSGHLAQVLLWDSGNRVLWLRYAAQLTSEGQLNDAQEVVRTALDLFDNDPALTEQQLRIFIARNEFQKGIEFAAKIPESSLGLDTHLLSLIGVCYANLKDYQQASEYFERALTIDPTQYEAKLYQPRVKALLKQ